MSVTPIADMIEAMTAVGSDLPEILIAVRTIEQRDAERHAERSVTVTKRSPGAIRSARHRAKINQLLANAKANDVASAGAESVTDWRHAERHAVTQHCDLSSSLLTSFPSKEKGIREVQEESKTEIVALAPRKTAARGTRMLSGAELSKADATFALDQGMPRGGIEKAWLEFVDYWIAIPGQRGTKLDWSATWRNRVRQIAGKAPANGRKSSQPSFSEIEHTLREQIHAATFEQPARDQSTDGGDEFVFDDAGTVPGR